MKKLMTGLCIALGLTMASQARAETTECTEITTIPTTITVQGVYCLKGNLVTAITSGNAIEIATNNVTIDFNGFKLGGLAGGAATDARGVYAENRKNITLRNGNIRGFKHGIWMQQTTANGSSGHLIMDSLLDGNTFAGIRVSGKNIVIRNNRVVNTDTTPPGGSSLAPALANHDIPPDVLSSDGFANQAGTGGNAVGILGVVLSDSQIIDNLVSNTISSGALSYAISVEGDSHNVEISRNTVIETKGASSAIGIRSSSSNNGGIVIRDNTVINASGGTFSNYGIFAGDIDEACVNNVVIIVPDVAITGCELAARNVPAAAP